MKTSEGDKQVLNLASLSQELLGEIFSYLSYDELKISRFLCRTLIHAATRFLFRTVRLSSQDVNTCYNFVNIASSDKLRCWVQNFICGATFDGDAIALLFDVTGPGELLNALPYVQFFINLKTIDVEFTNTDFDMSTNYTMSGCTGTVFSNYKRYVTRTMFECLNGSFSAEFSMNLRKKLGLVAYPTIPPPKVPSTHKISIRQLAFANAHESYDEPLVNSEAFKQVMRSGNLSSLKLLFVGDQSRGVQPPVRCTVTGLENTWLVPVVAQNLTTFCLYSHEHWGWCPKMDFRLVNATSQNPGFPRLKVLSLAKFVFSHDWQMEWIASLGSDHGGLEELYLDQCVVLCEAKQPYPLSKRTTILQRDSDGSRIRISNAGYLEKDIYEWYSDSQPVITKTTFPLRWHHMFRFWQKHLQALRVMKMKGGMYEEPVDTPEGAMTWGDAEAAASLLTSFQTFENGCHQPDLSRPWHPPDNDGSGNKNATDTMDSMRHVLQYRVFCAMLNHRNIGRWLSCIHWERDDPYEALPDEPLRDLTEDHAAFVELISAVNKRNINRDQ